MPADRAAALRHSWKLSPSGGRSGRDRGWEWLFYACEPDGCGPITMPPNGRIRRTVGRDYAILPKPEIKKHGT